jgi:hypothetical protein
MKVKYWFVKIFFLTLALSVGISVVAQVFISNMSLVAAVFILAALIIIGILFDLIGIAVTTCDETPLIAMSSRKIKQATYALPLLKNREVVATICVDLVGDIFGIVSGTAGAAIGVKIAVMATSISEFWIGISMAALISASTVLGKAWAKRVGIQNNKKIIIFLGSVIHFFKFKKR